MADVREALLRRQRELRPDPGAFDRLARRRRRRRRTQAGTSAVVALVLAALAVWGLGHAFVQHGSQPASRPITPDNVARLRVAWSAKVTEAAAPLAPIATSTQVFVHASTIHAYPRTCPSRSCSAEWIGTSGTHSTDAVGLAAGDRLVFLAAGGLWGFPQDCGHSAALCDPTWTASNESFISSVAVADGIVLGQTVSGDLYAYPEDCTGSCRPLWHARTYGNQSAPAVGGGLVFAQNDHALRAFPLTCRRDGGLCRAAWSTRFDSLSSQPVYADGRVYALRGEDEIVAFDAHCSRRGGCGVQGDWHVPGVSSFTVAGTHVYAASGDEVAALPATCPPQIGCHPLWRLGRLPAAPSTPVVADGLVFFTAGPQLYAVPTDCDHPGPNCASARVTDVPGNRSALSAATPTGDAVYAVGADGWLYAFTVPGH